MGAPLPRNVSETRGVSGRGAWGWGRGRCRRHAKRPRRRLRPSACPPWASPMELAASEYRKNRKKRNEDKKKLSFYLISLLSIEWILYF